MTDEQRADAQSLKEMGCPYRMGDPRTPLWLEGYKAGVKEGFVKATEVVGAKFEPTRKRPGDLELTSNGFVRHG